MDLHFFKFMLLNIVISTELLQEARLAQKASEEERDKCKSEFQCLLKTASASDVELKELRGKLTVLENLAKERTETEEKTHSKGMDDDFYAHKLC